MKPANVVIELRGNRLIHHTVLPNGGKMEQDVTPLWNLFKEIRDFKAPTSKDNTKKP